jgi:hypothetical protein
MCLSTLLIPAPPPFSGRIEDIWFPSSSLTTLRDIRGPKLKPPTSQNSTAHLTCSPISEPVSSREKIAYALD